MEHQLSDDYCHQQRMSRLDLLMKELLVLQETMQNTSGMLVAIFSLVVSIFTSITVEMNRYPVKGRVRDFPLGGALVFDVGSFRRK